MLNDIHDRLLRAKERLRQKQKLEAMLQETQSMLSQEQRKCRRHEQTLASEKADVEKLEGFSLTGLFYSVLGTKEERLENERQEYLAAKLKHEESSQAETLMNLSERLAELQADRNELQEAVAAGENAQRLLEQVRSELRSAANWGTWDLLGGGTISTWAKHSKIDSAKRQAQVAQRHLRQFQEELADADHRLHVSLGEIGGFSTFADYFFFDGLIADWVVRPSSATFAPTNGNSSDGTGNSGRGWTICKSRTGSSSGWKKAVSTASAWSHPSPSASGRYLSRTQKGTFCGTVSR